MLTKTLLLAMTLALPSVASNDTASAVLLNSESQLKATQSPQKLPTRLPCTATTTTMTTPLLKNTRCPIASAVTHTISQSLASGTFKNDENIVTLRDATPVSEVPARDRFPAYATPSNDHIVTVTNAGGCNASAAVYIITCNTLFTQPAASVVHRTAASGKAYPLATNATNSVGIITATANSCTTTVSKPCRTSSPESTPSSAPPRDGTHDPVNFSAVIKWEADLNTVVSIIKGVVQTITDIVSICVNIQQLRKLNYIAGAGPAQPQAAPAKNQQEHWLVRLVGNAAAFFV